MPLRLRSIGRPSWTAVITSLVAGGVIHIVTVMAVPYLAKSSAFQRIEAGLPANEMRIVPNATPSVQAFAFMAPDTQFAFCRFDISDGPVAVTAELPERGWSLTLYSDQGDGFHAVVGAEQRPTNVGFTIRPAPEPMYGFIPATRSVAVESSTVMSPHRKGLLVIRAPVRSPTYAARVATVLKKATCQHRPN